METPGVIEILSECFSGILDSLCGLLSSNLTTALAGAFAGAYGAHLLAEKLKAKERLLNEIRNVNASISIAASIQSGFLNFKEKVIKPIKDQYDKDRELFIQLTEQYNGKNQGAQTLTITTDFRFLEKISIPTDILQDLNFQKISLNGRPLIITTLITQTTATVNEMINSRNEVCRHFRDGHPWRYDVLLNLYFGTPDKEGNVDERYLSSLVAISEKTDDGIFFSTLLYEDLIEHGGKLQEQYGKNAPKINTIDFSSAKNRGLFPDPENYETWYTGFGKQVPIT